MSADGHPADYLRTVDGRCDHAPVSDTGQSAAEQLLALELARDARRRRKVRAAWISIAAVVVVVAVAVLIAWSGARQREREQTATWCELEYGYGTDAYRRCVNY